MITSRTDISGGGGRLSGIPGIVLFWIFGLALVLVDLADGVLFLGDVDDRMRMLQIRDLLADGAWYDRTLPAVAMPDSYVSPWSRLVDLPYALIAKALAPLVGLERGLTMASLAWPPAMLAVFAALAMIAMRRISGFAPTPVQLAATALAMTYALWEFTPGRVDHHNLQLVLTMAVLAGFCLPGWRGGAFAGIAAVLSVAVGLECLPFILIAFGICAIAAIMGNGEARAQLAAAGAAMTLSAPLAGLALIGPQAMLATECDAFSAPWIAGSTFGGAVLAASGLPFFARSGVAVRLAFLGIGAGSLAIGLAIAFPSCLAGPYAMVDDVSRAFWLDRVAQEESALSFFADRRYGILAMLGLAGFLLCACIPWLAANVRHGDYRVALVWAVAAMALILTFVQVRFVRFAPAFAPLFVPWLIGALGSDGAGGIKRATALAATLFLVVPVAILALTPPRERLYDAIDYMTWDECEDADFSVLSTLAPGRIMAPPGLSFPIAESAGGHAVASLSFHRASPGIRRVALAFTASRAEARRAALAPFDYVAVCARPLSADLSDAPLYAALVSGRGWPGLAAAHELPERGLHVYRIDHAALR